MQGDVETLLVSRRSSAPFSEFRVKAIQEGVGKARSSTDRHRERSSLPYVLACAVRTFFPFIRPSESHRYRSCTLPLPFQQPITASSLRRSLEEDDTADGFVRGEAAVATR